MDTAVLFSLNKNNVRIVFASVFSSLVFLTTWQLRVGGRLVGHPEVIHRSDCCSVGFCSYKFSQGHCETDEALKISSAKQRMMGSGEEIGSAEGRLQKVPD